MSPHRVAAQHGRRRHLVAGLAIGAAVAAALMPATAGAAGLVAAYDRYVPGKGFDIGLVSVGKGLPVAVPAGVNTTADELHPALTPDGRYMVFMRTTLQPKLNGDIVPPAERSLLRLDRQTGGLTVLQGSGAGPVFRAKGSSLFLSWGIPAETNSQGRTAYSRHSSFANGAPANPVSDLATAPPPVPFGQVLETPHAAFVPNSTHVVEQGNQSHDTRYLSFAYLDASTGAPQNGLVGIDATFADSGLTVGPKRQFGGPGNPASHPVPRNADNYVALDLVNGADADIQTLTFPTDQQLTPAPAPITTNQPERMPAWSPDGIQLGFVRTTGNQRKLVVFDATPGIQNTLNVATDLGADAPTPQTRAYQSVWGGLSLALSSSLDGGGTGGGVPPVTCSANCLTPLGNANLGNAPLQPKLGFSTVGQSVGIFVARVTGTRRLLGRRVPRISAVGRVPLGRTVKGVNRFRWNGKVNGRRLRAGTYLLTYRALKKGRVLSTSGSIRLTVTRSGKIVNVRLQR